MQQLIGVIKHNKLCVKTGSIRLHSVVSVLECGECFCSQKNHKTGMSDTFSDRKMLVLAILPQCQGRKGNKRSKRRRKQKRLMKN